VATIKAGFQASCAAATASNRDTQGCNEQQPKTENHGRWIRSVRAADCKTSRSTRAATALSLHHSSASTYERRWRSMRTMRRCLGVSRSRYQLPISNVSKIRLFTRRSDSPRGGSLQETSMWQLGLYLMKKARIFRENEESKL
jgi:hypothetical protein